MKKSIKIIFINIFCCLFITENTIAEVKLTIDKAVQMAYKHRPSLKAYKFATQAQKENENIALAGYLPQISMTDKHQVLQGSKGIKNSISLNASQLIYSFAGPLQKHKIEKKGTDITRLTEEEQKDYIRFEVESTFLQSWLLQKKNEFIESLKKSSLKTFKKSEHKNKLNLSNKSDWLQEATDYAENMSTIYFYTDELNNIYNQLEYLIGKKIKSENEDLTLIWNPKENINLKKLEFYYQKALETRKEIKLKQKEIEKYDEYKNYYKKQYLPSLNVIGSAGRSSHTGQASIGLQLSWNMFDGTTNYHEQNKANANKLKAMMEKESSIQQIKYEVQKAYYQLSKYLKQLVAKDIFLAKAQNEFNLKKEKYKIGDLCKVDMENAKQNWQMAKFNWLELKVSAAIKYNELLYTCGYPKEI